jgi:pyruvate-ferredoxin/flavodoxin oxidoreductase
MGAKDEHTLKAFLEAEAYDGPALIIAYAHCLQQGIADMTDGLQHQKAAVDSGQWLLYRFNPDLAKQGENPLILDSRTPKLPLEQYMYLENRFKMLTKINPEAAKTLLAQAQEDVKARYAQYQFMATRPMVPAGADGGNGHAPAESKAALS